MIRSVGHHLQETSGYGQPKQTLEEQLLALALRYEGTLGTIRGNPAITISHITSGTVRVEPYKDHFILHISYTNIYKATPFWHRSCTRTELLSAIEKQLQEITSLMDEAMCLLS